MPRDRRTGHERRGVERRTLSGAVPVERRLAERRVTADRRGRSDRRDSGERRRKSASW